MAKPQRQRRTKEREERLDEISAAAKKVFFEKGYFNSTIEEIARLAGVSKGTVSLYYKNKDELYVSLMPPMIEELTRLLIEFEDQLINNKYENCNDVMKGFCEVFKKIYEFDPEGLRIFQVYQLNDLFSIMPQNTRQRLWLIGKRNIRIFKGIISECINLGLLPKIKPILLVDILWASFLGIVQLEESKYRISQKNHLYDILECFFSLVSKGLIFNGES